jgi:predicted nucleic acid-binding protein
MAERWVLNASPLIVLCKKNHQHLLQLLASDILLPEDVLTEINAGPQADPARQHLAGEPFPIARVPPDQSVVAWDLGAGETAVLSYALNSPDWKAVIDDGAARRAARALGVPAIGTLGIIIRARQQNLIPAAVPLLLQLQAQGFYLNDSVIRTALSQTTAEEWP